MILVQAEEDHVESGVVISPGEAQTFDGSLELISSQLWPQCHSGSLRHHRAELLEVCLDALAQCLRPQHHVLQHGSAIRLRSDDAGMHLLALLSRQEGVPVGPCLVFWLHEVALLHFGELLPALVLWLCLGSSFCFAKHALFLVVLVYLPLVHEESYLCTYVLHQGDNTPQILDQFVGIELFTISSGRH